MLIFNCYYFLSLIHQNAKGKTDIFSVMCAITFTCQFSIVMNSQSVHSLSWKLITNSQFFIISRLTFTMYEKLNSDFTFFCNVFWACRNVLELCLFLWVSAFSETWFTEDRLTFKSVKFWVYSLNKTKVKKRNKGKSLASIISKGKLKITQNVHPVIT